MASTVRPEGNPNKKVFKLLPYNVSEVIDENGLKNTVCDYVTCVVPRDSQEQLFRSKSVVILTKIKVKKERNVIQRGFVLMPTVNKGKSDLNIFLVKKQVMKFRFYSESTSNSNIYCCFMK